MNDPLRAAFRDQRGHAKKRGVTFLLTYEEWVMIWIESGKLFFRGQGSNAYCMARFRDSGPYAWWNVKIQTNAENIKEAWTGKKRPFKPKSPEHTRKMSINMKEIRRQRKLFLQYQ